MCLQDCKKEGGQMRERKTKRIHCKLSQLSHTSVSHNGDVTSKYSDCFTGLSRQFLKFLCQLLATNVSLCQRSGKTGKPPYIYFHILELSGCIPWHVWGCLIASERGESMPKTPTQMMGPKHKLTWLYRFDRTVARYCNFLVFSFHSGWCYLDQLFHM